MRLILNEAGVSSGGGAISLYGITIQAAARIGNGAAVSKNQSVCSTVVGKLDNWIKVFYHLICKD